MKSDEGFTLLETLVALVVLAISLGVAVQSLALASGQLVMTGQARDIEIIAKELIASAPASTTASVNEGTDSETGYAWRLVSEPILDEGGMSAAMVTATVSTGGFRRQSFIFRTIRLGEGE